MEDVDNRVFMVHIVDAQAAGLTRPQSRGFVMKTVAGLALALILGLSASASAQAVKWDLSNDYQASSLPGQADQVFADKVKELSNASIEVTLHMGGALGYKSQDVFDAVRTGAVQIGDASTAFWGGINPIFKLSSLPFLLASSEEARLLYQAGRPAYEEVLAGSNQILLYTAPWPPSGIWADKPVDSLDALKGLKIRSYDTNSTLTMSELQASPVQLAWGDVVPQLAANGISAVLTSAEGGVGAQFWDHLNHFTEINYAMPLSMATLNKDAFDSLSDDQKKAVLDAARAAEDFAWAALADRTTQNYATMKEKGVTVVSGLGEGYVSALIAGGQKARDGWVAEIGPKGQAIIDEFQKLAGR